MIGQVRVDRSRPIARIRTWMFIRSRDRKPFVQSAVASQRRPCITSGRRFRQRTTTTMTPGCSPFQSHSCMSTYMPSETLPPRCNAVMQRDDLHKKRAVFTRRLSETSTLAIHTMIDPRRSPPRTAATPHSWRKRTRVARVTGSV